MPILGNHLIRKVSATGNMMTTLAGRTSGNIGLQCDVLHFATKCGDGGAATDAYLNGPSSVAEAPGGDILIADYFDQRVRKIVDGKIDTAAGSGTTIAAPFGDGGPATGADLSGPQGVAATPDGGYLIADRFHFSIRSVTPPLAIGTTSGLLILANRWDRCTSPQSATLGFKGHPRFVVTSSNTQLAPSSAMTFTATASETLFTVTVSPSRKGTAVLTFTTVNSGTTQPSRTARVTVKAGSNANDILTGTSGSDIIIGRNGKDLLSGGSGIDLLCGGPASDTLNGTDGPDILEGGDSNDKLKGGLGADLFRGGPGTDSATDLNPTQGDTQDGTIP